MSDEKKGALFSAADYTLWRGNQPGPALTLEHIEAAAKWALEEARVRPNKLLPGPMTDWRGSRK